jgi:hypothetical protein
VNLAFAFVRSGEKNEKLRQKKIKDGKKKTIK